MGRVFVDGDKLKGVLMDTGWFQMTGERRIGQLTGTLKNGQATVNVAWSTGPKVEFRGEGKVQRRGLILDLDQYSSGRPVKETQFTMQAHRVGDPLKAPFGELSRLSNAQMAGEWSGSYTYGPNRGLTYVTLEWDGSCNVVMANESPNDDTWNATGSLNTRDGVIDLTVDSGFSKQAYKGKVTSIGPDQIVVKFDRKNGEFVMSLQRW